MGNAALSLFVDVAALGVAAPSPPHIVSPGELFRSWKRSSLNYSHLHCSPPPEVCLPRVSSLFQPRRWRRAGQGVRGEGAVGGRGRSGGRGGGAEQGEVPGRGRALWLPAAVEFPLLVLTRDKRRLDPAESPTLAAEMCWFEASDQRFCRNTGVR